MNTTTQEGKGILNRILWGFLLAGCLSPAIAFSQVITASSPARQDLQARWKNGPFAGNDSFPIGVWLQNPRNAERYRQAGINLYIGLWKGPTEEQLQQLKAAGMPVICSQNRTGMANQDNPIIVGWMHGDEPDNAQPKQGGGYGPPIEPATIVERYEKMKQADPTRPVLLNLGQGVAWNNYIGRGVRRNHPEDYPEYLQGCDIASFDIYPAVHSKPEVAGKLEFVANGVKRLVKWTDGDKPVWNCIECTHIGNPDVKPTPHQVRAEVWMSLIHGSRGLIYFVHQFEPSFIEAGLLADPGMLKAVTEINRQIQELAPVLNGPSLNSGATIQTQSKDAPVAGMLKRHDGVYYLFTAAMSAKPTTATIELEDAILAKTIHVIGEDRTMEASNHSFSDEFKPYAVHLYRIEE